MITTDPTPFRMAADPPTVAAFDDHLSARLLHQRIVVLGQEVDDPVANRICAQLLLLSAEDPRRDISLYINSPGGSVSAGLAIMDTMRLIPNDVSTLAMGLAASMGQFLLSAGTKGKRYALPHARVLMHQGSAGIGGTAVDIEIQAQNLEHVRDTVLGLIAEHTGQPLATDRGRLRCGTGGSPPRRRGRTGSSTTSSPRWTMSGRAGAAASGSGRREMSSYTIPNVVEKRPTGERSLDIYSRLLSDRIVYLGTEIDDGVANVVVAQLLHLESENSESRDQPLHQLPRRLGQRDVLDLRHPAVHRRSGGHHLRRPGGVRGRGAAGGRERPAGARSCRTAGCCCTSRRRRARAPCPTSCCRPARSSGCAARWRRC